jgi:hypothetical protein
MIVMAVAQPVNLFVMKLDEKELDSLIRKVKSFIKHAEVEDQRIILWSLLKETVTHDWKGVKWLYGELSKFVEEEFGRDYL